MTPNLDKAAFYQRECFAAVNSALGADEITKDQWGEFVSLMPLQWWDGKADGGFDAAHLREFRRRYQPSV